MKQTTTTLGHAYIDFANFAEAEDFAKRNNGEVRLFKKYNGERIWSGCGYAFEPLSIDEKEYGADCIFYYNGEQWRENCEQVIEMLKEDEVPVDVIDATRHDMEKIAKMFDKLKEGEAVATFGNTEYAEIIKVNNLMSYCTDDYCYEIGVVIDIYGDESSNDDE